jgi:hypothetical protein
MIQIEGYINILKDYQTDKALFPVLPVFVFLKQQISLISVVTITKLPQTKPCTVYCEGFPGLLARLIHFVFY